jgi:ACT domain-containing protein
MMIKKNTGRPIKVDYKTMMKIADALQHSATVSDACRYAGISRDTYYRYLNSEPVFKEKMETAKANQYKLISFMTLF